MDLGLRNATALITGASMGIGFATARLLTSEGCRVAINARDAGRLDTAAASLHGGAWGDVLTIPGDMSDPSEVSRVVETAIDRLGHLDILVACAGSAPGGLLDELSDDDWGVGIGLKLMGYVRSCKAVLPHMLRRGTGSVVLVVGNTGLKPYAGELVSGVMNAADINFASALAEQYGPAGIRVNTVNPGPVNTSRWDGAEEELAARRNVSEERARQIILGALPLGRLAEADEVASLVAFLASPRASYINGAHILIDGGQRKALMDVS